MNQKQSRNDQQQIKLYALLLLLVIPPLGLAIMWKNKLWSKKTRKNISVLFVIVMILMTVSIIKSPSISFDINFSVLGNRKSKQNNDKFYQVVKVVDGDTIKVEKDGKVSTIRLIGINTPETKDPRKPVECFGVEASNKMISLVNNQNVELENDDSQDNKDKYGRILRYVFLTNGTNVNYLMIKEGYAYEYTYNTPYKYQKKFKDAQSWAQQKNLGLWSPKNCS